MSKPVKLPSGRWRIRYIDADGKRRSATFATFDLARSELRQFRVDAEREQVDAEFLQNSNGFAMSKKRGERILGPYRHHAGWRVMVVHADGTSQSRIVDTETKAQRLVEVLTAELAKDDVPTAVSMSRLSRLSGWVYAVLLDPSQRPMRIKIGWTTNIRQRTGHFRTTCPDSVLVGLWDANSCDEPRAHREISASGKGVRIRKSDVFVVDDVNGLLAILNSLLRCDLPMVKPHEDHRAVLGARGLAVLMDDAVDGRPA